MMRAFLLLFLLLAGCHGPSASPAAPDAPDAPVVTPAAFSTPATHASGLVGPDWAYPRLDLTPGDIIPGATRAAVCTPGYATSVRAVSESLRRAVFLRYGVVDRPGRYEVDHFISLELGGSNSIENLWPEPYEPRPGAHEKDLVENRLHQQLCSGALTLTQAQDKIRVDWYAVYKQVYP